MLIAGNPSSDHSEQHDGSPVVSRPRGAVLGADGASTASYSSSQPVKNAMPRSRATMASRCASLEIAWPSSIAALIAGVRRCALAVLQRAEHLRAFLQHERAMRGLAHRFHADGIAIGTISAASRKRVEGAARAPASVS